MLFLAACGGGTTPTSVAPTAAVATLTPAPTASPTPAPDALSQTKAYLAAWQAGRYAEMHGELAAESQSAWPAADFEAQYRSLLETMSVTAFTAEATGVTEAGETAQVTAHVRYETALVGVVEADLSVPLKREGGLWRVVFSPALIWPELVDGRQLLMVPLTTERGRILDRNGVPLAEQTDAYAVGLVPGELPAEGDAVPNALGRLLGLAPSLIPPLYANAVPDQYLPITEVDAAEFDRRYSFLQQISGVYLTAYNDRYYYGAGAAAHVTGYTTFIQPDELASYRAQGYTGSERVGRAGLEAWAESYLAGRAGGQLQLRDASNTFVRMIAATEPTPAQDVLATIDFDLQRAAQFALGDFPGAIVVLNRDTGEVLALASTPTFSPNLFSPYNRNAGAINQVLSDSRRPLVNHAAQSSYPAGSIFKVVTMAAGLTSGLFQPDTSYTCTGEWNETGDPTFTRQDWKEGGHGELTLTEGLSASCNPWFWHVGYALFQWDPRWLSDTARAFGLGQLTQTQLDESPGQIPDPDWKQRTRGETWSAIDSLNLSIGQGDVLVTPLQMARLAAAVGNGGTLYQPQFVREIRPADGGAPSYTFQPVISSTLPLSTTQLAAIQTGMLNVLQEPVGTARNRFRGFRICVAGKTGTAEDPGLFGEQDPDAWFMGYTCAGRTDKPDIAVAVVVQNRGQGSDYAAPIFRRVLEAYFGLAYVRYPWESAVGVPAPEETPTPEPGVEPATSAP
ncbi:MAG: hypothetical protein JNK29_11825 [Anaerolineales bacterium]|nr:hypothetical protein [Anaerolineales bacterium]